MLQQAGPTPELGTADALGAIGLDQVSGRPAGETIAPLGRRRGLHGAEVQWHPQGLKGRDQPLTGLGVGREPMGRPRPAGQGIGQLSGMQDRPPPAGTTN